MCRFVPEKNLHHLISAFSELKQNDIKLVLAGDADFHDNYYKQLVKQAQEAGVILTGFVKGHKLNSLLSHCRTYCLPSSHEGLPIALLEAMSYGANVIVSDIPANKEVHLPAECYFKCGNVEQLSNKLFEAINTPYSRTNYDMTHYNWETIANQTQAVYNACINP